MPQNFEEKYPNNGMNRDDESRYLENGDSRFILNTRAGSSEDNNVGAIENIKGTIEVTFDLPEGRNKCIGSEGDQSVSSNFFFVWNSLGDHTIYRYLPDSKTVRVLVRDSLLNFSEHDLINDINVVDDMLKWRDINNPPRKINYEKADNDSPTSRQVFHWYLGDEYLKGEVSVALNIKYKPYRYSASYSSSSTIQFPINQSLTKPELAKDIADRINNITQAVIGTALEAESCGDFVKITVNSSDYFRVIALKGSGQVTPQVVPQNHYSGYVERTIDAIKHPPHCELKANFETNDGFNRNYVEKKVFQFASRYIYDDDEKSTVNPHSISIYNKYVCDQFTGNNINNYIKIDLSVFTELLDPEVLQTIKRIELYVKEGKLGVWRTIKVLEQFEFVDTGNQHYDFYNDGIYTITDQVDFVRPFDLVPQKTKNQEVVKNRTFYANNLEGYDNTCVDATIDVEYDDAESRILKPTHTISGTISIRAAFNARDNESLRNFQPIYRDDLDGSDGSVESPIVFGGISAVNFGGDQNVNDMSVKTGQILPLGGFTVYLAGTDHYAISNQRGGADGIDTGAYSGLSQISQDNKGVFVGSGGKYIDHLREYAGNAKKNYGQLYSTFEIKNVPDGWYSLRIASHQTTQSQIDSGDRSYQKTSTNAFDFTRSGGSSLEELYGQHELIVRVQGGDIQGIRANVMDLSYADGTASILSGYVVDSDIETPVSDFNTAISDTRMSRSKVSFNESSNNARINIKAYNYWLNRKDSKPDFGVFVDQSITDHNGFFFFASSQPITNPIKLRIKNITPADIPVTQQTTSSGIYNGILYGQNGVQPFDIQPNAFAVIASRTPKGRSFNYRTWVQGKVSDSSGTGIIGSAIISNRTPPSYTESGGDYGFWHYGIKEDAGKYHTLMFPSQTTSSCTATFVDELYAFWFDFESWYFSGQTLLVPNKIASTGTPSAVLKVEPKPSFIGDIESINTINSEKRGSDQGFGIVYYDRGNRSGAVNTSEVLQLHIPFYTEKDASGNSYPGVPILNWSVKHRPPSWATHWQWVRTRNTTIGSYFQWALKSVSYEDSDSNPATYSTGTRVVLDYSNILTYTNQNPSMDFEMAINAETTRVRFIKNSNGTYFTEYYDFKVLSGREGSVVIEKDFSTGELSGGLLVEFYNEILDIDEDIYYEFGECFEVKEDINRLKYHSGETTAQDQNPLLPFSNPATGTFRTGDAYYRLRSFPGVSVNTPSFIDDDSVSDFYSSEVESIGRPNAINSDAAQTWKPNQIRHSNRFIPDTKVNGFSTFYANSFEVRPIEYGDINKLKLAVNVLISIHEFRWVSNYIEESLMRKQGGADELVATTDIFGSFRAAKNIITGTVNQESVAEYKGNIYAFDKNKGLVNRWGSDGLTTISDYKMSDYFSDKSKEILNVEKKGSTPHKILGVYDSKFNEYIISFGEIVTSGFSTIEPIGTVGGGNPTDVKPPISILKLNVTNSQIIEDGLSDTLYAVKSEKRSGSILIFDEATSPELKDVQIENREDSLGVLDVKVRKIDGVVEELVRLERGQAIKGFSISSRRVIPKEVVNELQPPPSSEVLFKGLTVSFSENIKKWITFYSFKPEMFGIIDLEMISFTNGKLWVHNENEVRNNFYGKQYTSQVETIFNKLPNQVKVFQSVGAESYHLWTVPSAKTPNGRETEMTSGRFVRREDSFFSSVMRDKNDPSYINSPPEEAMINGRQLRDRTISVLFENEETEEAVLYSLSMLSTISSRHGK